MRVLLVMVLLAMGGIVLAASYILWMLQRVVLGQAATSTAAQLPDITRREMATLAPLAMIVLLVGVFPQPLITVMNACANKLGALQSQSVPFDIPGIF